MAEFIFEIGVEELPARELGPSQSFIKEYLSTRLTDARLSFKSIEAFATPRRLVAIVDDMANKQEDSEEEILGPSIAIAFNKENKLSQAGLGFIKAKGIDESQIYRKITEKGEVIAAKKFEQGQQASKLLTSILLDMMRAIPFKKRMRWEPSGESFSRPVRWLLCLLDGEILPLSFADVSSDNKSRGHRFMNPEPFVVKSKAQYLVEMRDRYVMLSEQDREDLFIKEAKAKCKKIDAEFRNDPELMATVRNIFEYPFVILGSFEKEYLKIPSEILICEMKSHQKCFSVYNKNGELLPYFLCSAGVKPFDEEVFAKGNARVLRARFEDGAFYFLEDQKKTLREHAHNLAQVIFERDLGTIFDKSIRIEETAGKLAKYFHLDNDYALIKEVAPILKADLVTGVVGQFPELQGIMGHIYADINGEKPAVSEIIEMHYWPRFADDELPKTTAAALVSIADRIDTLVGIIAIGKKPSGNKDPFALRRAAIGIVRMLIHFGLSIDLYKLVDIALLSYGERFLKEQKAIAKEAVDFILQRARGPLIDDLEKESKDYAKNFADSAFAKSSADLVDTFARAHTLYALRNRNKNDFDSLVQAIKRASNIVKKADTEKLAMELRYVEYLITPHEIELLRAIEHAKTLIKKEEKSHQGFVNLQSNYREIFSQIAAIKPKLDAFFDHVMVMVDDDNVRHARLALLSEIKGMADHIADFTHL